MATDYLTRCAKTTVLQQVTAAEIAKFCKTVSPDMAHRWYYNKPGRSFNIIVYARHHPVDTRHSPQKYCLPTSKGLIEWRNRTLADLLLMYIDVNHNTWDEILPYVTFANNMAVQQTIRFTPFELVCGRQMSTTLDAMLPVGKLTRRTKINSFSTPVVPSLPGVS